MFARKVSRLAGLVFVLAAVVGGVTAATVSVDSAAGDVVTTTAVTAGDVFRLEIIWD